jgi:hypothetical protein
MTKIKLAYRQIIDAKSAGEFEKKVFHDSYHEFFMQSQAYHENGTLKTFDQMIERNPKANSLHYKVGFSIGLYISSLKGWIPGLQDNIGNSLAFESFMFKILYSDVSNKAMHKVAIIYTTDWLDLLAICGNYVILAPPRREDGEVTSTTISLQPNLSIVNWDSIDSAEGVIKGHAYQREAN